MKHVRLFMLAFACFCLTGCASGGGANSKSADSGTGDTPLNVNVTTSPSVTITWTTDQPSTTQVQYGTTAAYANISSLDPALTTSHSVTLTSLSKTTIYHYRVLSSNASGNQVASGDLTFTTE